MWGRLRRERRCTITKWSLAARRCLFRMGPRYGLRTRSVNRLRLFRMVCVVIRAWWRLGVGLHCLRRIWQSFDGVVPSGSVLRGWFRGSQSLVGDVSTRKVFCGTHWNVWRHLQSSSWFAAYPLSFLCRRWWGPGKSFFVGMMCFFNAGYKWLQTFRCVTWFPAPQVKMSHSESIL